MPYKHGAYGEIAPSQEKITTVQGTIPMYIGTAPIFRLESYQNSINNPLLIRSLEDAKEKLGYMDTDNFQHFTLSAAVFAHFKNRVEAIGPFVVVNVLNPEKHMTDGATASITLVNKVGYINDYAILDSISVDTFVKDEDFTVEYTDDGRVKFTAIDPAITTPVSVNYKKIDISKVTDDDVIGMYDPNTNSRSGIQCIETIYEELNIVPNILTAPGWNHKPIVEQALIAAAEKYDNHYDAIVITDIDESVATTVEGALQWKETNNYVAKKQKVCWPKGKVSGRILWMSIIAAVRMQQTDSANDGIPYETPSNKQIDIVTLVAGDKEIKLNSVQANKLNEKGITTALYNGGKWVLWGPHMANYDYSSTDKPDEIFDVNIRMSIYLSNDFQLRNANLVDSPIARNDVDGILNLEQMRLNSLVADGKLLYGAIEFIPTANLASDLIQGDFNFDTQVTNTPPGKSLTNRIQYTTKGISTLIEGGE